LQVFANVGLEYLPHFADRSVGWPLHLLPSLHCKLGAHSRNWLISRTTFFHEKATQ